MQLGAVTGIAQPVTEAVSLGPVTGTVQGLTEEILRRELVRTEPVEDVSAIVKIELTLLLSLS